MTQGPDMRKRELVPIFSFPILKPREFISPFLRIDLLILLTEAGMSTSLPQKKAARLRQRFVGKKSRRLAPHRSISGSTTPRGVVKSQSRGIYAAVDKPRTSVRG
jgi:hypothetical protein